MNNSNPDVIAKLSAIARTMASEITPDLMGLAELLDKCGRQPGIDNTIGSFASIIYRLCDAYKSTANLGYVIQIAIDDGLATKPVSDLVAVMESIAEGVTRLIDGNIVFLSCDVDTLRGHPEVELVDGVGETLHLVRDQIWEVEERVYGLGQEAMDLIKLSDVALSDTKSPDPAWYQMQQLVSDCVAKSQQARNRGRMTLGPMTHPKPGENGKPWLIKKPTESSAQSSWHEPSATAVFVPGGRSPAELNGVPMASWTNYPDNDGEWNALDLLAATMDEPLPPKTRLPLASGVVTVEPDGRIWLVSPTNQYGGYETTLPKGKLEGSKLTLQANAIKEAFEESGLMVRLTAYLGDFKRTTSMTRLYLGERLGGNPSDMGWESQAVRLVPLAQLQFWLTAPADKPVLKAILTKLKH